LKDFIFPQLETNSLPPRWNSTWRYSSLFLSNGCNPWSTFLAKTTHPWYVIINNSMRSVCRICFSSADKIHNKATSFLFKHGSWCVSFTCLSFCSNKVTSQTVKKKTFTNKYSIIFFSTSISFSSFPLPFEVFIISCTVLSFSIFSFSLRWSLLIYLGFINLNFILCPSRLKYKERSSRYSVLKRSHLHPENRWHESIGAIPHNTSFTHCLVPNLIHSWFGWKIVGNWSFSSNLWLTTLLLLS